MKSGERITENAVRRNETFKEMEAKTRVIKKHILLLPPLTPGAFHPIQIRKLSVKYVYKILYNLEEKICI
jgi:hypothetical protein